MSLKELARNNEEMGAEEQLRQWLVGAQCIGQDNRGDYLQIQFGTTLLIVGGHWRITQRRTILVASGAEDTELDQLMTILDQRIVRTVAVVGEFHDLRLTFDDDLALDVWADSARYEHWNFVGGAGNMIVAGPGAAIALWQSKDD